MAVQNFIFYKIAFIVFCKNLTLIEICINDIALSGKTKQLFDNEGLKKVLSPKFYINLTFCIVEMTKLLENFEISQVFENPL